MFIVWFLFCLVLYKHFVNLCTNLFINDVCISWCRNRKFYTQLLSADRLMFKSLFPTPSTNHSSFIAMRRWNLTSSLSLIPATPTLCCSWLKFAFSTRPALKSARVYIPMWKDFIMHGLEEQRRPFWLIQGVTMSVKVCLLFILSRMAGASL